VIAGIAIVAVLVVAIVGWLLRRAALAQQALHRSEERLARAMEASDSGVWEWNPTTDRAFLSTRARQLLGIPEGQHIDTRTDLMVHGGFHPEDVPRIEETLRASLAQRCEGLEVEYRVVNPAGQIRWIRSRGKTFCDAQGRPLLLVRSLTDITERKLAEKALHENEERFTLAMSGSNQGIFDWDLATDQVFLSRRAQELCGLEAEVSWKLRDDWLAMLHYHPDDLEPQRRGIRSHLAGETPAYDIEFRLVRADGECRWFRQRGVALRDASGKAYRMAGSIEDVTERKLAGEALRESEARFRSLTELSSDWYWRQDENLRFTYLSSQANDLTGYTGQSSIGKLRWELANMTPLSTTWPEHQAVLAARKPFRDLECRRIGPDGAARYLSMSGAPIFDNRGEFKGYHGIGRNITDRKCIEEELRARQDMLDLAQKAARAVAFEWRLGADEVDNRLSPDLETMHGLAPGSPARQIYNWKKVVHPDDWPVVRAAIKAAQQSGDIAAEYRIVQPDGAVKWLQAKGRMVLDAAGKPLAMVGFLFDVTERHHAEDELRRLERQLRQAQRLEAMGTLAGGIAHDFNNILGAVLGYGEMALRGATKGSRLRRDLDNIMTAGERGRSLVEQILAFSRSSANERVAVHLERVAGEALDHLAAHMPPHISVEPRLHAGDAAVMGDPTQVHQVVMNLAKNAFQAMPSGGTVRVLLEPVRIDTPRVITTGLLEPGDYVLLEVADSGVGIAPEIVDRIFDPFFTTKEVGLGTGLGLSLVHGIVTELGGAINVASAPGAGSVFTVYLPRADDAGELDESEAPNVPRGNRERVLVVDDEEPLMRLATETLEDFGYRPVGFTSSLAALEAFRADPLAFDAVITDERMPGMTGSTLVRELRRMRATIPVMLMSGFVGGAVASGAREAGADEVLKKPLSGPELVASLARVLQRARVGVH
jgi:PAS domain S-box-containing protein